MTNSAQTLSIEAVIDCYRESFASHGDSPAAVLWPRGRQELRFDALTSHFPKGRFSVLDFGCGLAHLKPYLESRFSEVRYMGADIVPEFIEVAKQKHPDAVFDLVRSYKDVSRRADHVVASGTFNIVYGKDASSYSQSVREALVHLLSLCDVSLAVNFMTDCVDYRQPNAHHENVEDIYTFVRDELSPRLVVNQAYMPYEFTIVVFKDCEIVRPENIYRPVE